MKKIFFIVITILFANNVYCQLRVFFKLPNHLELCFYNDSSKPAYFTDPTFFFLRNGINKKTTFSLRQDQYLIKSDTLNIYLTDSTLFEFKGGFASTDSVLRASGIVSYQTIYPKEYKKIIVGFRKKLLVKHLTIYYNFSYDIDDFKNKYCPKIQILYLY